MAWYKTGTITVTNGSTTVIGSGTQWILNAEVGEALYINEQLYEITNIASDTALTIAPAYLGSTAAGQDYVIVPSQSYIRDLAEQAADLVNQYSTIAAFAGQGKFGDGTLAAPGIRYSDDLDTGFFRSAANEVTFVAGGVAQFKYNASGLVLTGATSAVNLSYTGTLTGGTGVINIGSGQVVKDADGNVGIGTSTLPSFAKLSVLQTDTFAVQLMNASQNYTLRVDAGVSNALILGNRTSFTDVLAVSSSGNVGIGTSTPQGKFDVVGSVANTLATFSTADASTMVLSNTDGAAFGRNSKILFRIGALNLSGIASVFTGFNGAGDISGALAFGTQANAAGGIVERARIDASGNLLVGKTSAANSTNTFFRSSGPIQTNESGSTTPQFQIVFTNPNGNVGTIVTDGTSTGYNTSSDYRLKEDAQPVPNPIERLMQLNPINFAWKIDGSRTDGFLAHEAQAVVPQAVTGTKDAVDKDGKPVHQGIDQSKLVPLLTAALQDAIKRIEQLELQINSGV